jgi:hypothetical protein
MATNMPLTVTSRVELSCVLLTTHAGHAAAVAEHFVDVVVPYDVHLSCLLLGEQLVLQDLLALNLSRRWTTVTFFAMFARYSASSTAVLPPPITATSWLRKKKPSQVAQAETP